MVSPPFTAYPSPPVRAKVAPPVKGRLSPGVTSQRFSPSSPANLLRLWRGVHTMFVGCVPAHALYVSTFEAGKTFFGADDAGHNPVGAGLAGAAATLCHDSIMSPLDTVKQRLQLGHSKGMWDCIRTMQRNEGMFSFYRSFPTTLAMNLPCESFKLR